jgi:hypothetical protein
MASTLKNDIVVIPSDLYTAISNVSTTVPYSTQIPQLGVRAVTGDGREFRYVQAGASALIVGQVIQSPALVANGTGTCPVLAVGALSAALTVSSSTYAANALAGGYFATYGTVANGGGQNIRISGNTAVTAGTTLTVTFDEPVPFAINASANFVLVPAKYNGVVQIPTTATGSVAGIALGITNNTSTSLNGLPASYFGWLQVKGFSNVLIQGTPAIGTALAAPGTAVGSAGVTSGTTSAPNMNVGMNLATGVDGRYGPVDLLIS